MKGSEKKYIEYSWLSKLQVSTFPGATGTKSKQRMKEKRIMLMLHVIHI